MLDDKIAANKRLKRATPAPAGCHFCTACWLIPSGHKTNPLNYLFYFYHFSNEPPVTVRMNIRQFGLPLFITLVTALLVTALITTSTQEAPTQETLIQKTSPQPTTMAPAQDAAPPSATDSPRQAGALNQMVIKLEQRLQRNDGSAEDWLLLGKTYQYLGQPEQAEHAYNNALTRGYDASKLKASRADMARQQTPAPQPPAPLDNPMNAHQLTALNQGLSHATDTPAVTVKGTLTLSPEFKSQVSPAATLFIFARAAQGPPSAPFAVLRLQPTAFPVSFVLDDRHAIMPGRTLSSASSVVIGARLSASGNASAQPGDLEGFSTPITVTDNSPVRLEINQTHP